MLTNTFKAYLYQQYADDEDLQAFVDAYNEATQAYITWFSSVSLPFYPGLSGDLLDWVAHGLYGMLRPAVQSQGTPALGTLNTQLLNVVTLNKFTPPVSSTYYALSDDMFQRILTWNLFKGDGNRFCIRWLKRRVMRFLAGTNGLDPSPWYPGFTVGTENTSAIGIGISGGTVTVTIHQTTLASLITVTPQLLTLFQDIFEAGILDLPAQYSYTVTLA
ncbi:MAG TPA: hypothetical protein VI653_28485 [Steroidobacteraceae bacterium]